MSGSEEKCKVERSRQPGWVLLPRRGGGGGGGSVAWKYTRRGGRFEAEAPAFDKTFLGLLGITTGT